MARFRHIHTGHFKSASYAARFPHLVKEEREVEAKEVEDVLERWEADFEDADFFDEMEFDATPSYGEDE